MIAARQSGMTLIEVLVSMTLLAMLATLIAQGVQFGSRAWGSAERQSGEIDDVETVQALLRRTIEAARPALVTANASDLTVAFRGEPSQLGLVVPQAGTDGTGAWTYARFYVAQRGAAPAMVMSWRFDAPATAGEAARPPDLVLDHVAALRLAYFGPGNLGEAPRWLDRWADRDRLPLLVRIAIERTAGFRPWPEMVVAVRASSNPGCPSGASGGVCDQGGF